MLHFLGTDLLAALREADVEEPRSDRLWFGPLLKRFFVSRVLKLASWSETPVRLSHFRTREQEEVDLLLDDRPEPVVCIEVKASATVRWQDFIGFTRVQAAVGSKFVLHARQHSTHADSTVDKRLRRKAHGPDQVLCPTASGHLEEPCNGGV